MEANGDTGMTLGANGMLRLMPKLVRAPDVSYTSWEKVGSHKVPTKAVPHLVPDFAVEVYSPGNRRGEMRRKLGEYLGVGIAEIWIVYPKTRSIRVYRPGFESVRYGLGDTLAGIVLPGFQFSLATLFDRLETDASQPETKRR